ncbi:MAG: TerC family protein, partial [Armatimonadetes bacterium]|nr:TerC family protein [Armatimonadota bacterium]MDW8122715.1 TerC family protein [Armatimonadota bacterium]
PHQEPKARQIGVAIALTSRLALLFTLTWMMKLTQPLLTLPILNAPISGKSLILLLGGLFLIAKSTYEIHNKLEGVHQERKAPTAASFAWVIAQIVLIDIVFSLDSVITAIGMARQLWVMVTAMLVATATMVISIGPVSQFVQRHPTIKILALSFLLLIGVMLVAEGLGKHIEKGYIYFAMGFSLFVELLNMRLRR